MLSEKSDCALEESSIVQRVQALLPPSVYYTTKGFITHNFNFVKMS